MGWLLVPGAQLSSSQLCPAQMELRTKAEELPFSSYNGQETSPIEVLGKEGNNQHFLQL